MNSRNVNTQLVMQTGVPKIDLKRSDQAYLELSNAIKRKLGGGSGQPLEEGISFHCESCGQLLSEHGAEYLELVASYGERDVPFTKINLQEMDNLYLENGEIVDEMVDLVNKSKEKRDEIVKRIHNAAIQKFAQHGLSGTSTQDIARQAGLSKAQLHYYITSKEDLYRDVLKTIMDEWDGIYIEATKTNVPREILGTYIKKKINHALEFPDATRMVGREIISGAPILREHWPEFRRRTDEAAKLIQSWVDEKTIAPIDPYLLQINIWALTQHYAEYEAQVRFVLQVDDGEELDKELITNELVKLFLMRCGI